jgi:hypothetical protein
MEVFKMKTSWGYPLEWPASRPRTKDRTASRFQVTDLKQTLAELEREVRRAGGRNLVINSNWINPNWRAEAPPYLPDPGVVVSFDRRCNGMLMHVFALDQYLTVHDNIRGILVTLRSLRTIERQGALQMYEAAMSAFVALPPPAMSWRDVLKLDNGEATPDQVETAFRHEAKRSHPDAGGTDQQMAELNAAREAALKAITKRE